MPVVKGHPELASHIAQSVILDEFDLTLCNKMEVDHGLTVPLNLMFGKPKEWPCPIIPLAVNVVQFPPPTGNRCFNLGKAISKAVESYPEDLQGRDLRHRRHVAPDQRPARRPDQQQVGPRLPRQPLAGTEEARQACRIIEYMREAGAEGVEMVMWLIMRGALDDKVDEVYRFYTVPASNTAVGHIILENRARARRRRRRKKAGAEDEARRRARQKIRARPQLSASWPSVVRSIHDAVASGLQDSRAAPDEPGMTPRPQQ